MVNIKKNIIPLSIIIFMIILCVFYKYMYNNQVENMNSMNTTSYSDKIIVPDFKDNIINIYDNKGNKINMALCVAPMNENDRKKYDTYKDKILFLGMTSYLEYPNVISNPSDLYHDPKHKTWKFDYKNNFAGWFYCFKDPDNYFPIHIPKLLLSESDFVDAKSIKPDKTSKKKYDFIYICHKYNKDDKQCPDDWVTYNKNWKFTLKCLYKMCVNFKLKGLLVGRMGCKIPPSCEKYIDTTEKLPWKELLKKYNECKFVFVPNIYDASPRIITEAMATNLPILLNKNILGGWKYINKQTGVFFNNIDDLSTQLQKLLDNLDTFTPRKYIIENYGIVHSGKKMLEFIKKHYSYQLNLSPDIQYITPRFKKIDYTILTE
jgi:glycosyltransferase involved in cell wall biosynthesis